MTRFELYKNDEIPNSLEAQLNAGYRVAFPWVKMSGLDAVDEAGNEWGGGAYILAGFDGETLTCSLEMGTRTIDVGGVAVQVGTVGGVMVMPDYQKRGLGRAVMADAEQRFCAEFGVQAILFYCGDENVAFYEKLGYSEQHPPTLIFTQSDGRRELPAGVHIMAKSCDGVAFPTGIININGKLW
ncbi:MAG: GNAT family N-acetyltransferase [Phototrophicaceae bacterium]